MCCWSARGDRKKAYRTTMLWFPWRNFELSFNFQSKL
jgi:hypothetical protein